MKRMVSLVVLVLFLCGCQGKQPVKTKGVGFSFGLDLAYYNEEYSLSGSVFEDGVLVVEVTAPEDLSGLKLTYKNQTVKAEYMGLTYTPDNGKMPVGCATTVLYELLRLVEETQELPRQKDGQVFREGKVGEYWYRFFFSPLGLPLSFEVPACGLTGVFHDVTLLS